MHYSYIIENETELEFEYLGEFVKWTFNKEGYKTHIICNHPIFIDAFKSPWIVVLSLDSFIAGMCSHKEYDSFFAEMENSLKVYLDKIQSQSNETVILSQAVSNNLSTTL
jgi:hypothetical protein